jgi:hypothetical protein
LVRSELGNDVQIHVGVHQAVSFEVELAGAGTAGNAPAYAPLLRACGMSEALASAVSATYKPDTFESATLYFNVDGQQHKLTGCRGTWSLGINPQNIPTLNFTFTDLWNTPSAVSLATGVFTSYQVPLAVSDTNTPTATLHGVAMVMEDFSLDIANEVSHRDVVNSESIQIVDRSPTGSVKFEAPALGTKDWFSVAKANTTGALQIVHGLTSGNIIQIDAPAVQLLSPSYEDSSGITMINTNLSVIPSSGDDEISLVIK